MNIAIFGSSRPFLESEIAHRAEFKEFCLKLGDLFAQKPHTVLRVASDGEITADRWIVESFAARVRDSRRHCVEVYPREGRDPFREIEKKYPSLIVRPTLPEARKAVAAHLRMLLGADAALLVGGKDGVLNAGLAATLTRARVWPVGYFRGGAWHFVQAAASTFDGSIARMPDRALTARLNTSVPSALAAIEEELDSFPRVMIVHGRSEDRKEVSAILNDVGISRVDVLVEQSREGRTIIEEFEAYASLSDAAIAIATPDDFGVAARTPDGRPVDVSSLALIPRARQNVLLEYGWFWSRLGRRKTLLLVKGDVDVPSDLFGVKVVKYTDRPGDCRSEIEAFINRVRGGTG